MVIFALTGASFAASLVGLARGDDVAAVLLAALGVLCLRTLMLVLHVLEEGAKS
ncbi:MAG: hypothetical protein AAGA56_04335 [Myxococcota bacterium]